MDAEPLPIFVYGTLLLPEVQRRILGRSLEAQRARVAGYARGVVEGQTYPSLRVASAESVEGALLTGGTAGDLALLDAYEGERYSRMIVSAHVGNEQLPAWVWMLGERWRDLVTMEAWDLDAFVRDELEGFLASYEGLSG